MKYNFSSNMTDRINFDNDMKIYIESCFTSLDDEEIKTAKSEDYFNADEIVLLVSDVDEAKARFDSLFEEVKLSF
jgi:protein associated with RNAse G/E